MDIFLLESVIAELKSRIPVGSGIAKIHQPGENEIIIRFWTGRENLPLLLSTDPRYPRLHLAGRTPSNPFTPPRFCQLLRSRLRSLISIDQFPQERIVHLRFRGDEKGDYLLIAELFGAHGNLLLVDGAGMIQDVLHRRKDRNVLPGKPYRSPEIPPRSSLADSVPEIPDDECRSAEEFRRWLLSNVAPMSPLAARELAARMSGGESPGRVLDSFRKWWLTGDFHPHGGRLHDRKIVSVFPLKALPVRNAILFDSPSRAVEWWAHEASSAEGEGAEKAVLQSAVRRTRKKLEKRLVNLRVEEGKSAGAEDQRHLGELLLANLNRVRRGMKEVAVEDYYSDPPVQRTIDLDPRLSPQENAELFFRSYKKGKKGSVHTERRRAETLEELEWLEGVELALDEAGSSSDLEAIRRELTESGLLKEPARKDPRKPPPAVPAVEALESPGGYRIYRGKNNRANDHVSRNLTGADDIWFHALNMPGCHVVLKKEKGEEIPEEDLLFAASVAAAHSRGGKAAKVEVMVAGGKWVKKPKGARPGAVLVEKYRTVVVRPIHPDSRWE